MIVFSNDEDEVLEIPVGLGPNVSQEAAHPLQNKQVDPSTSELNVTADSDYYGLNQVTVNGVTSSIDSNIIESNIRKDVTILGVTGNLESETVNNQDKTVNSSTTEQNITADNGYSGLGTVTVNPYTLDSKSVNPSTNSQTVTSSEDGLSSVTVNAVNSNIDPNILSNNIKNGVTILGVTGSYSGTVINNQNKTVDSSTVSQSITADNGYTGLGTVTVTPYSLESQSDTIHSSGQYSYVPSQGYDGISQIDLEISFIGQVKNEDPSTNAISVEPDWPYEGLSRVNINAVTSSIDSNITAGNIKNGVTILGVTGSYSGQSINNQNKTVNPSTNSQSITADASYTGLGTVTVNPVNAVGGSETITQNGTYTFDGQSFGADYLSSLQIDVSVNSSAGSDWYIAWKLGNKHDMSDVDLSQVMTTYRGLYNMFNDNANPSPRYMSAPPVLGGSTVGMNGMNNAFYGVIFTNQNGTEISFPNLVTASGMIHALSGTDGITKISFPELTSINGQQAMQGFFSERTVGTLIEIYMPKMQNVSGQYAVSSWVDDYVTGMASRKLTVHVDALRYSNIDYNVAYWMGNSLTELVVTGTASYDIQLQSNPNLSAASVLNVLNSMGSGVHTCTFYTNGLSVTDDAQGSLQTAYNAAVNAGWTINNLTIIPYS